MHCLVSSALSAPVSASVKKYPTGTLSLSFIPTIMWTRTFLALGRLSSSNPVPKSTYPATLSPTSSTCFLIAIVSTARAQYNSPLGACVSFSRNGNASAVKPGAPRIDLYRSLTVCCDGRASFIFDRTYREILRDAPPPKASPPLFLA
uniref:Putative secreted protein n=1 Tax=Ixodes ricinus TaxID=34613 RepID=A0A6B0UV12_IXORI